MAAPSRRAADVTLPEGRNYRCPLPYAETGTTAQAGGCDDEGTTWVIC